MIISTKSCNSLFLGLQYGTPNNVLNVSINYFRDYDNKKLLE